MKIMISSVRRNTKISGKKVYFLIRQKYSAFSQFKFSFSAEFRIKVINMQLLRKIIFILKFTKTLVLSYLLKIIMRR